MTPHSLDAKLRYRPRIVVDGPPWLRFIDWLDTTVSGATYVFPSRKRSTDAVGPIGERALIYIIGKYAERARVADVSPHDLRHRFGYQMARVVPLHRLAQIMGQDSLDTTLRCVRGTQQDLQLAVESIAWA